MGAWCTLHACGGGGNPEGAGRGGWIPSAPAGDRGVVVTRGTVSPELRVRFPSVTRRRPRVRGGMADAASSSLAFTVGSSPTGRTGPHLGTWQNYPAMPPKFMRVNASLVRTRELVQFQSGAPRVATSIEQRTGLLNRAIRVRVPGDLPKSLFQRR